MYTMQESGAYRYENASNGIKYLLFENKFGLVHMVSRGPRRKRKTVRMNRVGFRVLLSRTCAAHRPHSGTPTERLVRDRGPSDWRHQRVFPDEALRLDLSSCTQDL